MRPRKIKRNNLQAIAILAVTLTSTPLFMINDDPIFNKGSLVVRVTAQDLPVSNAQVRIISPQKSITNYTTNRKGYALNDNQTELRLDSGSYEIEVVKDKLKAVRVKAYIPEDGFVEKIIKLRNANTPPIPVVPNEIYLRPRTPFLIDASASYDIDFTEQADDEGQVANSFVDEFGNPNGKRIESFTWQNVEESDKGTVEISPTNAPEAVIKIDNPGTYYISLVLSDGIEETSHPITVYCDEPLKKIKDLPTPKAGHTSTMIGDKAVVIGGWNRTFLKSVEEYDFFDDQWRTLSPIKIPRNHHVSLFLNGQIFVIGGHNQSQLNGIDAVEMFDMYLEKWTTVSRMPTARYSLGGGIYNDKIYVFGGHGGERKVEVYDPVSDKWETLPDMPLPRSRHTVSLVKGKFYLIGGKGTADLIQEFDPETGIWKTKNKLPIPRYYHKSVVLNDKIYVVGGYAPATKSGINDISTYDPVTEQWQTLATFVHPIDVHSLTSYKNSVYIFGGEGTIGKTSVLKSVYAYNPKFAKTADPE